MNEKIREIVDKMLENGAEDDEPVLVLLQNKELPWDNPERFYSLFCFANMETLKEALKKVYPDCNYRVLAFLFQNYGYLESQIKAVLNCIPAQSSDCSKARWVLSQWFKHLTNQETEDIGEPKWYQPDFGNTNFWMQFCEVAMDIYYQGLTDKNMEFMGVVRRKARRGY